MFSKLYERVLVWAGHPHAPRYLGALSFAESSFFPIPPDVMLAPMVLATPGRAWWYATLTTVTSVLGGVAGYLIGMYLYRALGQPLIEFYHAEEGFEHVKGWFHDYGVWVVLIAGFTPIPYKLFTITSGVMSMAMSPFVLGSLVGRGARFFLVSGLLLWGGERFEKFLHSRMDLIGWTVVAIAVIAFLVLRFGS